MHPRPENSPAAIESSLAQPGALGRAFGMNEITRIFSALERGDPRAAEQLLPLVYGELRRLAGQRLAQEAPGQTLQATALVHEAYVRLVGSGDAGWNGRGRMARS
jgi:hypothetical protein